MQCCCREGRGGEGGGAGGFENHWGAVLWTGALLTALSGGLRCRCHGTVTEHVLLRWRLCPGEAADVKPPPVLKMEHWAMWIIQLLGSGGRRGSYRLSMLPDLCQPPSSVGVISILKFSRCRFTPAPQCMYTYVQPMGRVTCHMEVNKPFFFQSNLHVGL